MRATTTACRTGIRCVGCGSSPFAFVSAAVADCRRRSVLVGGRRGRHEVILSGANQSCHEARTAANYTATRWAQMINPERGVFPMLDAALLLRGHRAEIDWSKVYALVERSWGATGLLLLLEGLSRSRLADVPTAVLDRLEKEDQFSNRFLRTLLHRLVSFANFEGRAPGVFLTEHTLRIIWSTLVRPAPPLGKLLGLPVNLAFPAATHGRFDPAKALARLLKAVRRGSLRGPARLRSLARGTLRASFQRLCVDALHSK